jgi:putative nucleotidyltransferase with HDIG domain
METTKIKKIENKVRKIFYQRSENDCWDYHIKPVIEEAKVLAEKYSANKNIVWLSAILHDLGQLDNLENHEEIGAEKAYKILLEENFSKEISKKVKNVVLTHRCNSHFPEDLEQKILATADALTYFRAPHYLWLARSSKKTLAELFQKLSEKIERDFNQKIFFEDDKKMV